MCEYDLLKDWKKVTWQPGWQPIGEKNAERELIEKFSEKKSFKIKKLQNNEDDGGTDGIVSYKGRDLCIEARRKGYPNHKGKVCRFKKGWDTHCLSEGIFLNERTIRNHIEKGFMYLVEIDFNGKSDVRVACVSPKRVKELLSQRYRTQRSTNTGKESSVKCVPKSWFKKQWYE